MKKLSWFKYYPEDHLNDVQLRLCHPASTGIWGYMVCYMFFGSPRGHLRLEPPLLKTLPGVVVSEHREAFETELRRWVPQLPTSGSLEPLLPFLLGYPDTLVQEAIADLESHHIFNRDGGGIIYCRRMVGEDLKYQKAAERTAKWRARKKVEDIDKAGSSRTEEARKLLQQKIESKKPRKGEPK